MCIFSKAGVKHDEIGIITTYRAQVAQITYLVESLGVHVSTVDQYQGKDKNVIIYSCVKSEDVSKGRDTTVIFNYLVFCYLICNFFFVV